MLTRQQELSNDHFIRMTEKIDKERKAILFGSAGIIGVLLGLVLHFSYIAGLFV